jgi:hypothetical protein
LPASNQAIFIIINISMTKNIYKALGAASIIIPISFTVAAAIAVAGCAFYLMSQMKTAYPVIAKKTTVSQALAIHHVEKQAFGSLIAASAGSETAQVNAQAVRSSASAAGSISAGAASRGAGTGYAAGGTVSLGATGTSAAGMAPAPDIRVMPPIQNTAIEYVYTGDPVELKDATLDVMKYIPAPIPADSVDQVLGGLNLGVMNLASFPNANVTDFSLSQDTPFGYQISVSPKNGLVSIDQNWTQWQSAYPNCRDEACMQATQLKPSDVPSDDALIKIADDFLAAHHIDRSAYGAGEADTSRSPYPIRVEPMISTG